MTVHIDKSGALTIVTLDRKDRRNAVNRTTAEALQEAFEAFDADPEARVGILTGAHGTFCAGADLKAIAKGRPNRLEATGPGPMGPTRMLLRKPVIAAIAGHAVAGGLELALWCDLRIVEEDAVLGVFCRRFGVPLIDGGTVRLPRMIGLSHALDLILTGRAVGADEALRMGLANRVVPPGAALETARELATDLSRLPQACLRNDRQSAYEQAGFSLDDALQREFELGLASLSDPEMIAGVGRFDAGEGRHGAT
ncbi:MAG: crotonase/enoyl-CoA hydratase family protein [Myxococcota bacterium]